MGKKKMFKCNSCQKTFTAQKYLSQHYAGCKGAWELVKPAKKDPKLYDFLLFIIRLIKIFFREIEIVNFIGGKNEEKKVCIEYYKPHKTYTKEQLEILKKKINIKKGQYRKAIKSYLFNKKNSERLFFENGVINYAKYIEEEDYMPLSIDQVMSNLLNGDQYNFFKKMDVREVFPNNNKIMIMGGEDLLRKYSDKLGSYGPAIDLYWDIKAKIDNYNEGVFYDENYCPYCNKYFIHIKKHYKKCNLLAENLKNDYDKTMKEILNKFYILDTYQTDSVLYYFKNHPEKSIQKELFDFAYLTYKEQIIKYFNKKRDIKNELKKKKKIKNIKPLKRVAQQIIEKIEKEEKEEKEEKIEEKIEEENEEENVFFEENFEWLKKNEEKIEKKEEKIEKKEEKIEENEENSESEESDGENEEDEEIAPATEEEIENDEDEKKHPVAEFFQNYFKIFLKEKEKKEKQKKYLKNIKYII